MTDSNSPALPDENAKPAKRKQTPGREPVPEEATAQQPAKANQQPRPVVFGEVLFDIFPDGKRNLGGAPFNVACHLAGFKAAPIFVSAVGEDTYGQEILQFMDLQGMDTSCVQRDPNHPTGVVNITFEDSEPHYTIERDAAYDFIQPFAAEQVQAAGSPCILYHGTLGLRSPVSRGAFETLVKGLEVPTYMDLNLRPPWWTPEELASLLPATAWLKLNEAELHEIQEAGIVDASAVEQPDWFTHYAHLAGIILTRGKEGATVYLPGNRSHAEGVHAVADFKDQVGAGDAMSSIFVLGILRNWPMDVTLRRASAFAGTICGIHGAIPKDPGIYTDFETRWAEENQQHSKDGLL